MRSIGWIDNESHIMTASSRIAAVAFDLDGLLVNTEELYQHVGTELLRRRGHSGAWVHRLAAGQGAHEGERGEQKRGTGGGSGAHGRIVPMGAG